MKMAVRGHSLVLSIRKIVDVSQGASRALKVMAIRYITLHAGVVSQAEDSLKDIYGDPQLAGQVAVPTSASKDTELPGEVQGAAGNQPIQPSGERFRLHWLTFRHSPSAGG